MPVNKANMRLWVAALRSKKFKQTRGNLKRISLITDEVIGHCCLGVICELAIEHGVNIHAVTAAHGEGADSAAVVFLGSSGYLPTLALTWLGFEGTEQERQGDILVSQGDIVISVDADGATITAVGANDNLGWDFDRIADEAEKYYRLLEDDDEPVPVD